VGVTVELVSLPEQRRELFALRYRVYVAELGGVFPASARTDQQLREDVDEVALNYGLFDGDQVVGSLRVVDLHSVDPTSIVGRYGLGEILARYGAAAICLAGRLALDPAYRSRGHMVRLVHRAYADARARGVRYAASDCSPNLVPLYCRLGYRVHGDAFVDPIFGPKVPIVWPLDARPPGRQR
jgi:GNAT superfamily N-acetyltransferase